MNARVSGEIEAVLSEMKIHRISSGSSIAMKNIGTSRRVSVNQGASEARHDRCVAATRLEGSLLLGGLLKSENGKNRKNLPRMGTLLRIEARGPQETEIGQAD